MATARTGISGPGAPPPGKRGFANRARAFAKRARPQWPPPGFPLLWIAGAAAALLMIVTGGFGSDALPLPRRIGFWLLLMGWNTLKWQIWFALTVRKPADWIWSSAASALLLSLPIPFEIRAALGLLGIDAGAPGLFETWGRSLTIGAGIFVVSMATARIAARSRAARAAAPPAAGGLLDRARTAPEALAAVEAEDHYCRVRRRDGSSALVHYRFGDAVAELAAVDGAQVHRGAWVAAAAVLGAERAGRRWRLLLAGGATAPVSARHAAEARRRGWLRAPG